MAFRKLLAAERHAKLPSSSARIVNYDGKMPRILLPVCVIEKLDTHIGAKADILVDEDATPTKIAIVVPGKTVRIAPIPGTGKGGSIVSASLRRLIPKTPTREVEHEISKIEGRNAVILTLPDFSDAMLKAREASNV